MIEIDETLRQPMAQALGWALLQFLWQGALIGVLDGRAPGVVAAERRRRAVRGLDRGARADADHAGRHGDPDLRRARPGSEDPGPTGGLGSFRRLSDVRGMAPPSGGGAASRPTSPVGRRLFRPRRQRPTLLWAALCKPEPPGRSIDGCPMLLTIWLAGVAMLTLRLLSGWLWVQRMKSHDAGRSTKGWSVMARRLMRRLHIVRAVRFLESTRVDVPTVIGWLTPVVLLPGSVLSGLTPRQVEAILAHELAHIRRHDYLVNLLQTRGGNAAVLPSGRVVALAPHPGGAGELLRRSRGEPVRRSRGLCRRAGGARGAAIVEPDAGARRDRRLAAAAGQAAAWRTVARRPRAGLARGRSRGDGPERAVRRAR